MNAIVERWRTDPFTHFTWLLGVPGMAGARIAGDWVIDWDFCRAREDGG